MPIYTCEQCGMGFQQRCRYLIHQARKTPCGTGQALAPVPPVPPGVQVKTMRYLGNKSSLLEFIYDTIDKYVVRSGLARTIFDGFGGTGSVTQYFGRQGFIVTSNDVASYAFRLCFSRNNVALTDLRFEHVGGTIQNVIETLNACRHKGFVYYNYSPNSELEHERKYFTNENAEIIDGIRTQIETWHQDKKVTYKEYMHLVSMLIETASLFSNIPGTYGAFLSNWDSRALRTLELTEGVHDNLLAHHVQTIENETTTNTTYNRNLRDILSEVTSDVLYIDPPYNERDYLSYYHVLETISKYDNPELKNNKTGTKAVSTKSAWCSKKTACAELEHVVTHSSAKLIVMSYNDEGIIPMEFIRDVFMKHGTYHVEKKQVRRFKCAHVENAPIVHEYLHILERGDATTVSEPDQVTIEPVQVTIEPVQVVAVEPAPLIISNTSVTTAFGTMYNGCCLTGMAALESGSVDLVCCDLPYGLTECKWDTVIDLEQMWAQYSRIIKPNGTIILFGQQPFTSRLVASNYAMFKYSLVWQKSKPGGFAQAPYKILCEHEDILVFTYGKTTKNSANRMTYNPQGTTSCNIAMKGKTGSTEHRKGRSTQADYVQTTTNYPRSILKFGNEGRVKHPTQKPLALIEYLINTFSNEGDVVLDNCMGSATSAVACINTNRKYIGYEKEVIYYNVCNERIGIAVDAVGAKETGSEET